ncbi:hypothetical protein GCM10023205_04290 [Yinghuangia aomiensis]|uniref:Uncharacterized protein n=1 Tax=Yinghuangia aomiensis TaxID=676205 RepID=A0ABP9GLM6_9ACTN
MDITVSRFASAHELLPQLPAGELLAAPELSDGAGYRTPSDRLGLADYLVYPTDPPHPGMPEQPYLRLDIAPSRVERAAGALTSAAQSRIAWRIAAASGIDTDARSWIAVTDDTADRIVILAAVRGFEEAPLDLWTTARRAEAEAMLIAAQLTAEQQALATPTDRDFAPDHDVHLVLVEDGPLAVHGGDRRARHLLRELGLQHTLISEEEMHRTPFGADPAYCRALADLTREVLDNAGYYVEIHHRATAPPRPPSQLPATAVTHHPAAGTTAVPSLPAVAPTARHR